MKKIIIKIKQPGMVNLIYSCTLAKFAEQIGIKLWQAMCMMKYAEFKKRKDREMKLIGMWLFCDSIFSLRTYWNKEDVFCQGIRWVRLICSTAIMVWG